MRILAVGDVEARYLWDYYEPGRLDGYEMILAAGDLDPQYLSFLATFCRGPVLYVHGNHDGRYERTPPEGCISIEDTVYTHHGIRIAGLGGSVRYSAGAHQFTEEQMARRVRHLLPKVRRANGFDILLTHAPALGLNDGSDPAHAGFSCFLPLLDQFQPAYFVHGHVHSNYGDGYRKRSTYGNVTIINAYERQAFEITPPPPPARPHFQLLHPR